jgi:uncharacterized membrane protein YoaK (UPF0700 family)
MMSVRSQLGIARPRAEGRVVRGPTPSVDSSLGMKMLPSVLSMIAGSADVIGFLGLGGLFTAHITGNLILIAAHIVSGTGVSPVHLLSVPVFIAVLGVTRLLVAGLEAAGLASLRPLLLLQLLLLTGFLTFCVAAGPSVSPNGVITILAGMLGVSAMAVQNAMVVMLLKDSPSTAVMTTNITRFVMDVGEVLLENDPDKMAEARRRARHTFPAIIGFAGGAGLGAACFVVAGLWSLMLPTTLALLAFAISLAAHNEKLAADLRG